MKKESVDTLLACCFAQPGLFAGGLIPLIATDDRPAKRSEEPSLVHMGSVALGMLVLSAGPGWGRVVPDAEAIEAISAFYPGFSAVVSQGLQLRMQRKEVVMNAFRSALIECGALNPDWPPVVKSDPQPATAAVPEGAAT